MRHLLVLTVILLAVNNIYSGSIPTATSAPCGCHDGGTEELSDDEIKIKIKICNNDNAILKDQLEEEKNDNAACIKQKAGYEKANRDLECALNDSERDRQAAEDELQHKLSEIKSLKDRIEDLQKKLCQREQELEKCKEELCICGAEGKRLNHIIDELNCKIKQLEDELYHCEGERQDLKNKLDECNEEYTICDKDLCQCQKDRDDLKDEIDRDNCLIKSLEDELAKCEENYKKASCGFKKYLESLIQQEQSLAESVKTSLTLIKQQEILTKNSLSSIDVNCDEECGCGHGK